MIHFYATVQIKDSQRLALCNELTHGIHTVEKGQQMIEKIQHLLFTL